MVRDDRDNRGVTIVFYVLMIINLSLLSYTAWKLRNLLRLRLQTFHILVLYTAILLYSACTLYVVRILWYLDVAAHYPNAVYYALEEAPDLLMFTAYSTIACLWMEIYLSYRRQRPCSSNCLFRCRLLFTLCNFCLYIAFIVMQTMESVGSHDQYE